MRDGSQGRGVLARAASAATRSGVPAAAAEMSSSSFIGKPKISLRMLVARPTPSVGSPSSRAEGRLTVGT